MNNPFLGTDPGASPQPASPPPTVNGQLTPTNLPRPVEFTSVGPQPITRAPRGAKVKKERISRRRVKEEQPQPGAPIGPNMATIGQQDPPAPPKTHRKLPTVKFRGRSKRARAAYETTDDDASAVTVADTTAHARRLKMPRWAGARKVVLLRRLTAITIIVLLAVLVINIGKKASRSEVSQMVAAQVAAAGGSFPAGDAVMWSAPLIKGFGTYDSKLVDNRAQALAPYVSSGLDPQLGWNGQGSQQVIDMVISSDVHGVGTNQAVVYATIQIGDGSWRCVAVPVISSHPAGQQTFAFALTSAPTYVPCGYVTVPTQVANATTSNDDTLAKTFQGDLLPPFLAAWAQGDRTNLTRFELPGVVSYGLAGAYTGSGPNSRPAVNNVIVPLPNPNDANPTTTRTVQFDVTFLALDGHATQTSTYQVGVQQVNGTWYFTGDPAPVVNPLGVGGQSPAAPRPTQGPNDATGTLFPPAHATGSMNPASSSAPVAPVPASSATPTTAPRTTAPTTKAPTPVMPPPRQPTPTPMTKPTKAQPSKTAAKVTPPQPQLTRTKATSTTSTGQTSAATR